MNPSDTKCVIVIGQQLPPGVAANTSAILGITLGKQYPEAVGVDVHDKNGRNLFLYNTGTVSGCFSQ